MLKPLTRVQYTARRSEFNEWVRRERRGNVDLELNLLDYLDMLLNIGEKAAVGEKVVAAVLHSHPGVKRSDFKRVQEALQGFRKARPAQSRYPVPEEVMRGICAIMMAKGKKVTAQAVATAFYGYFRPGEIRAFLKADLVLPSGGATRALNHYALVVSPSERLEASKTQTFDDTVILDSPLLLGRLLELTCALVTPIEKLFPLSVNEMLDDWNDALAELHIPKKQMVWYQLRHGGASADLLERRRSVPEIQARGRWMRPESMRRYAKSGQIQKVLNALPKDVRRFTRWAAEEFREIMIGNVTARLPVPSAQRESDEMAAQRAAFMEFENQGWAGKYARKRPSANG